MIGETVLSCRMPSMTLDETQMILKRHTSSFLLFFLEDKKLLPPFTLVEGGAFSERSSAGYPHPSPLYWIPRATLHAFDAHPDNFRKLKTSLSEYPAQIVHHPFALGQENAQAELFETIQPIYSSFCRPLIDPTKKFIGLDGLKLHRTLQIETHRLTETLIKIGSPPPDALTIDCNGYELPILEGAQEVLKGALMAAVRIGHYPLYENQSRFGSTEDFLQKHGLQFHH